MSLRDRINKGEMPEPTAEFLVVELEHMQKGEKALEEIATAGSWYNNVAVERIRKGIMDEYATPELVAEAAKILRSQS